MSGKTPTRLKIGSFKYLYRQNGAISFRSKIRYFVIRNRININFGQFAFSIRILNKFPTGQLFTDEGVFSCEIKLHDKVASDTRGSRNYGALNLN